MKAFSNPTQGENTWLGSGGSPVQHQRERDQHFSNLNFGHSGQASHPSNNAPSSSSSFINTTNTNDTTSPSNTSDYPTNLSSPPNTGLDPSSLAPIGNRYGISPGAISDFSNEAQGGHSGSIGTSIFGTSADSPLAQYQLYSIPNPPGTHGGEGGGGSQIPTYPTSQHASSVSNSRNKNSIGSSGNSNSTTTTSNYPGPSGGLKESQNFLESMSTDHLGGGGHGNEQQQQQPLTRASFQSLRSSMDQSRPSPVYDHDDLQAITGGIRGVGISGHQQNSNSIDSPTAANRIGGGGSGGGVVGAGSASYGGSGLIPSSSNSFSCDTSNGTYVNSSVGAGMAQTPSGGSLSAHLSAPTMEEIVPTTFDEGMLRALCDMDCGMPLLFDRIKQSMVSAREASTFLKKRAAIEEEYARNLSKLTRATMEAYSIEGGKAGTYVNSWQSMMRIHETLSDNRLRFAGKLTEMSDELSNLAKEVDKNRKQTRETGLRLEKNLQDAENGVEKARSRFDATAEDLERLLLLKSGESAKGGELQTGPGGKRTLGKAIGKSGLLFKNKNPQQILKQEEEIRARTSTASDAFRKEVLSTQGMRQEYFNLQLPRILRSLKESSEEIDNGTQYHLARYAFLYETTLLSDAMTVSPVGADATGGLKAAVEAIDSRTDFKQYVQNYQIVHGREYKGPRREGPYEEGFLPPPSSSSASAAMNKSIGGIGGVGQNKVVSTRPIFGVDLSTQMTRDGVDVPPILEKCAEAIEQVGITNMGIYRLSGTSSKVQRLKNLFDQDWTSVDLMNDEAINDINIVAGCLKLWFRELPEPLLTYELYPGFIEAAKVENERLRHIRLHERVNELPDANYATLKYLMGHLDKVRSEESSNQMSASNLAIVFGPTLLSPPPPTMSLTSGVGIGSDPSSNHATGGVQLQDMSFQCRAIETILDKYREIFVDENE